MVIATISFGDSPDQAALLRLWCAHARHFAPRHRLLVISDAASPVAEHVPVLRLELGEEYAPVLRPGEPFDKKGALLCEAALRLGPFLYLDSDAFLVADPTVALCAFGGNSALAMPIDHGVANISAFQCSEGAIAERCAGVAWFGTQGREMIVLAYQRAFTLLVDDPQLSPTLDRHLIEQYAWALVMHWLGGATLPDDFNHPRHQRGPSKTAIVHHYFGGGKSSALKVTEPLNH